MMIKSNVSFALNWVNPSSAGASRKRACPLLQRDQNLVAFDSHVERLDLGQGVDRRDATRQGKRPAVPGALHRSVGTIDVAFAERPAAVRADVVEREVFAVDVEQRDG